MTLQSSDCRLDGLILVDKPPKITSHDVVAEIRKILHFKKVGHFGTLDPLATGLLLVSVGRATKLFPFFSKENKVYKGRIRLGFATDTYDALGKPTSQEIEKFPDKAQILRAMKKFKGVLDQVPPHFSAKKHMGKPLYKLARQKKAPPLKPLRVEVNSFDLKAYSPPYLDFEVKCGSGTYIRSLAHDLGQLLGCGAHLAQLARLEIGSFKLASSFTLEIIKALAERGQTEKFLIPLEGLFNEFPKMILKEAAVFSLKKGCAIMPDSILEVIPGSGTVPASSKKEPIFRLFTLEGKFLALARSGEPNSGLTPFLVLGA